MRSEIAANLNVLEFVQIFGEICKTLGVRWSNRYGVTAPLHVNVIAHLTTVKLCNANIETRRHKYIIVSHCSTWIS